MPAAAASHAAAVRRLGEPPLLLERVLTADHAADERPPECNPQRLDVEANAGVELHTIDSRPSGDKFQRERAPVRVCMQHSKCCQSHELRMWRAANNITRRWRRTSALLGGAQDVHCEL
jgi:hypothetical protein